MSDVDIIVVGLQGAGGFFAKELARLLFSVKNMEWGNRNINPSLTLFDDKDVVKSDVETGTYLPEDIGWNRAAVLGGCLKRAYGEKKKIEAYAQAFSKKAAECFWNDKHASYVDSGNLTIVADFSTNKGSLEAVAFLKEKKSDVVHLIMRENGIGISYKVGRFYKEAEVSRKKTSHDVSDVLQVSHSFLAVVTSLLNGELVDGREVNYDLFDVAGASLASLPYGNKKSRWLVVCVGAGGTGGNFCKEFPHVMLKRKNLSLLIIDGDRVEEKNTARQPFLKADLQQNKAQILCEDLLRDYPVLQGRIASYGAYLDNVEDVEKAVSSVNGVFDEVLLVGCVDNHAARRVLQSYHAGKENSIYIDAANEWSNGEVVVSARKNGMDFSPVRSFYFPEVMTDTSPSASQLSCGVVNESAPQHLVTNLASAQHIYSVLMPLFSEGHIHTGILFFDAFRGFSRYQPYSALMNKEAAYA